MARSLKGKKFFFCTSNGVTAVIEEGTLRDIERRNGIERALGKSVADATLDHLPKTPVFTFADSHSDNIAYFVTSHMRWVATALKRYIVAMEGMYEGGSFYVPFSNGHERHKDRKMQAAELRYVTSEQEFVETFGVTTREIERDWCDSQVETTMRWMGFDKHRVKQLMEWFEANANIR